MLAAIIKNYFMKKEVHTPCTPDYRLLRSRKNVWGVQILIKNNIFFLILCEYSHNKAGYLGKSWENDQKKSSSQ